MDAAQIPPFVQSAVRANVADTNSIQQGINRIFWVHSGDACFSVCLAWSNAVFPDQPTAVPFDMVPYRDFPVKAVTSFREQGVLP